MRARARSAADYSINATISVVSDPFKLLPDKLPDKLPDNCPINASTKDRVFAHIRTNPGCSRQQIAESIGLSVESVKLALAALREGSVKIEHRGSNKTGGYYAKEQNTGK